MKFFTAPNFYREPQGLQKIDDIGFTGIIDRKHCVIATVIAQVGQIDENLEFHVDARLWDHPKHTAQSQGTLILHEILYAWQRQEGATDSENTRKLVRLLIMNHGLSVHDFIKRVDELFPKGHGICNQSSNCNDVYQIVSDIKTGFYGLYSSALTDWYSANQPEFYSFAAAENQTGVAKSYKDAFADPAGVLIDFDNSCAALDPATWGKNFGSAEGDPDGVGFDQASLKVPACQFLLQQLGTKYPRDLSTELDRVAVITLGDKLVHAKLNVQFDLDAALSDGVLAGLLSRTGLNEVAKKAIQAGFEKTRVEVKKSLNQAPRQLLSSGTMINDGSGKPAGKDFAQGLLDQYFDVSAIVSYPIPNVTQ